jgi:hypothetical protein
MFPIVEHSNTYNFRQGGASDFWQSRDSLCQSFGADMRVVSAHSLGVVSDQFHDDSFRGIPASFNSETAVCRSA